MLITYALLGLLEKHFDPCGRLLSLQTVYEFFFFFSFLEKVRVSFLAHIPVSVLLSAQVQKY